jgi:hypothetical protein
MSCRTENEGEVRTRTQCLGPHRNHDPKIPIGIGIEQDQHSCSPGQRDLFIRRWRRNIVSESVDGFLVGMTILVSSLSPFGDVS